MADKLLKVDKLLKEGKITSEQATKFKAWEAARPGKNATQEQFEAWMKSRPNVPGMQPLGPPHNRPFTK